MQPAVVPLLPGIIPPSLSPLSKGTSRPSVDQKMTPLVGEALAMHSDCSSANSGVAAASKRRLGYKDRMLTYWWTVKVFAGLVEFFERGG